MNDLISELRRDPTPEERVLAEATGLSDGHPVPFHMFAKVAMEGRRSAHWIREAESLKKWIRRNSRASLGALATMLLALGGYGVHRIEAKGAADAHAIDQAASFVEYRDSVRREMDELRRQISELRADFRRWSGAQPEPPRPSSDFDYNPDPDKLSELDRWNEVLASALPKPKPQSTCGSTCSSSIECSSGVLKPCPFCNFGTCKSTRPESPTKPPPDAGVDAPTGTTP